MKYLVTKFNITAPNEEILTISRELLAASLAEQGYESFMDTDEGMEAYIQDTLYNPQAPEHAIADTQLQGVEYAHTTEAIPDQDWNEAWEAEGFDPIEIGQQLTIYDARRTYSDLDFHTPLTIGIQARNAFGTGTHPTTRMVLSTLLSIPLSGQRLLDCGTGTGILSILALMRGADSAIGYDIDEWSSENAKHNAMLNGVADRFTSILGDSSVILDLTDMFDVVTANINRNIILADIHRIASVMAVGAHIVMSGFYESDADTIIDACRPLGLSEVSRQVNDDWCCLLLRKS